jgi:hypothetical protein
MVILLDPIRTILYKSGFGFDQTQLNLAHVYSAQAYIQKYVGLVGWNNNFEDF